jgi:hypothetical protein
MVWRKLSIPMACGLGPLIILALVLRNWHGWASPPFWLDDLAAGLLILSAAVYAYRDQSSLRGRLVTGAFGLSVAVMWGAMFEVSAGLHSKPEEWSALPSVAQFLTVVTFLLSLIGLVVSLPSARQPMLGTRPEKPKARR